MDKESFKDNSQKKYKWLIDIRKIFSLISNERNAYVNEVFKNLPG